MAKAVLHVRRLDKLSWRSVAVYLLSSVLLAACARGPSVASQAAANPAPGSVTVSRSVTASVLITSEPDEAAPAIATIALSPESVVIEPGGTLRLSARAFDSSGRPVDAAEYSWAMADPRAGSITRNGSFRAAPSPGVFKDAISVTAVQNSPSGIQYASTRASVTIVGEHTVSRLSSVAIVPSNPTVLSGQVYRLRAVGYDEDGLVIPGVSFVWSVNDPALGHINDIGYLTVAGRAGTYPQALSATGVWNGATVSTTADVTVVDTQNIEDFVRLEVLPQRFYLNPGEWLQLRAITLNGVGEAIATAEVRWSLADPRAGTISGTGLFVAGDAPGIYTEAIRVEALVAGPRGISRATDYASVIVREQRRLRRLESVSGVPLSVQVVPGGRALFVATATDADGDPADNVVMTWEATHPDVGTIDDRGSFIASTRPGHYPAALRVTARQSLDGEVVSRSRSIDVTITGTLTEVEMLPPLATIAPGKTVHFRVVGRDENGNALPGLVVLWSVTDKEVGSIDAFGNFLASANPGLYPDVIRADVIQTLPASR